MEEHRLKPMPTNYDREMFKRIYNDTEKLRYKLARDIDSSRFGLTFEDIVSAFTTKLLYTFTRYYGQPEGVIKANVIRALQNYRMKTMRKAYTHKHSQTIISTDLVPIENAKDEDTPKDFYYEKLMSFMKDHLSENAFALLDLQLNPTPYILHRVNLDKDSNLQKIPDDLLLEYFDLGYSDRAYRYLAQLKKEIRNAINYAKSKLRVS